MLERRRVRRSYQAVPGEEGAGAEEDLELGEGIGPQESGVTEASGAADGGRSLTLEEEVDNWDENAMDAWDEADVGDEVTAPSTGKGKEAEPNGDHAEPKKRSD